MCQDSFLIYELILSAFDHKLKFNFIKQIVFSWRFTSVNVSFIEVPGKKDADVEIAQRLNRSDIIILDESENLLMHLKIDKLQENYLLCDPIIWKKDALLCRTLKLLKT